jgi:cytochrome c556
MDASFPFHPQEGLMRRFVVYTAVVCVALGSAVIAQKVTTPEELDKVMKKANAFRQVDKAIQSNKIEDAKKQLEIVRSAVQESRSFWVEHKREDALKLNAAALEKLDALDKVLSAERLNVMNAAAAFKDAGGACRACHQVYRTEDANNQYMLKPGSVPGVGN